MSAEAYQGFSTLSEQGKKFNRESERIIKKTAFLTAISVAFAEPTLYALGWIKSLPWLGRS
jgi:hypothetical protein